MSRLLLALLLLVDNHPLTAEQRKKIDEDCRAVLEKSKDLGARGDAHFKLAEYPKAVAVYDQMVVLEPALEKSHWRRGIAYFYAGEFAKAAHQFEIYNSFDNVDRENGIWRYLSQLKAHGKEKAREGLLKYEKDDREPFPDVYQLFEGKRTPDQILAKIQDAKIDDESRESRFFYAHLYIGLNYAVEDKPYDARRHLKKAVANSWGPKAGFGPNYMWHVARVHYEQLIILKDD
jgi:lipoprotein NlpI